MIDKTLLQTYAADLGVSLDERQLEQFDAYARLLCEWNEKMNLTGITDPYGIVIRHFLDSLTLVPLLPDTATLIDVGTGAGFPAIPAAIARPDVRVTLLDSLQKRLTFLNVVCEELGLKAQTVHARAEDGGQRPDLRESFDAATARAVASLPTLCEYCVPFVKRGGVFVALKGPDSDAEIASATVAAKVLGASYRTTIRETVPRHPAEGEEVLSRRLIVFDKVVATPKAYPRPAAKIAKKPLG